MARRRLRGDWVLVQALLAGLLPACGSLPLEPAPGAADATAPATVPRVAATATPVPPVPPPAPAADGGADSGPADAVVDGGAGDPTLLIVTVTDGSGGPPMPAKLVLYDEADVPLRIGRLDSDPLQELGYCDLAPGAIGTWAGIVLTHGSAEIPVGVGTCDGRPAIPYGRYRARALRDTQHEIFETWIDLRADRGRVHLEAPLSRAFEAEGWLSADLHVHSEHSGDTAVPREVRVVTMAAAGVQVIASTDHDYNADYTTEIESLGLGAFVASLPGNEASSGVGHFNLWPVVVDPTAPRGGAADYSASSAGEFLAAARALPGQPLVQVNHARLGWAAYFDEAGWDGVSWPPPMPVDFDALEVLSGFLAYETPDDQRLSMAVQDFYTLWRNGVPVTALGNSDTHHLNLILGGFPRSYVRVADARTEPFDQAGFIEALRARRTVASTGPFLDVRVEGAAGPGDLVTATSGSVVLEVHMRQPTYVHATRLRVWVGGTLRRTADIPPGTTAFHWSSREAVDAVDTWVGVDVAGDEPLPSDLVGEYLSAWKGLGGMLPFAIISPVRIDADGDGSYAPPTPPLKNAPDLLPPPPGPDGLQPARDCREVVLR